MRTHETDVRPLPKKITWNDALRVVQVSHPMSPVVPSTLPRSHCIARVT
jgi:hypothetical protein